MLSSAVLVLAAIVGQGDAEEAFKSWAEFTVDSTWSTTFEGVKYEIVYKRTLNGKFVQADYMHGDIPVLFLLGIDPATKKFTWFGFDGDGDVTKWVMTRTSENAWASEGKGTGPNGECSFRSKTTRIDADTIKEEIEHFVINGKQLRTGTNIWRRRR